MVHDTFLSNHTQKSRAQQTESAVDPSLGQSQHFALDIATESGILRCPYRPQPKFFQQMTLSAG